MVKSTFFSNNVISRTNHLKNYLLWFYIFGQNTCIPIYPSNKNFNIFIRYVPQAVTVLLTVLCFCGMYNDINKRSIMSYSNRGTMFAFISLTNTITPNIFAMCESFRLPESTRYLMSMFISISNSMERKFNTTIRMERFLNKFRIKIIKLVIFYSIASAYLVTISLHSSYYSIQLNAAMNFFKIVVVAHICFYIEFISFFLESIKKVLDNTVKDDYVLRLSVAHINETVKILRYIKYFHYKIHGCCGIINKHFGWIIIAIVLESASSLIRSGFYIFFYRASFVGENSFFIRNYF